MEIRDSDGKALSVRGKYCILVPHVYADIHSLIYITSTMLQQKKALLLDADGGVQKFRSVIRALVRHDKEKIDPTQINEDTRPSDVLRYIADQVASAQIREEKPEQIVKIIRRLTKLSMQEYDVSESSLMSHNFSLLF